MADVVMPRLSDTMQEGTILRWLKEDGDDVARGEELVEIETDKASMVYESDLAGTLEILASEGETLAVGEVIAHIGPPNGASPRPHAVPDPVAAEEEEKEEVPPSQAPPSEAGAAPAEPTSGGRPKASPLARRMAREQGIDLSRLSGTGPGGRIIRSDVESGTGSASRTQEVGEPTSPGADDKPVGAARSEPQSGSPDVPPQSGAPAGGAGPVAPDKADRDVTTAKGETTTVELSRTQQTIARRMAESKATIPDFSLEVDVDMEACVALREELVGVARSGAGGRGGDMKPAAPTYNDMVVKACALALREQPRMNSSYRDGRVQLHGRVNVGVAVAADDALIVPTVFDADTKALGEIARETHRLAARVRSGEITPPELGGGTFTVSNLGMLGARSFTAIINPPQSAILTVGTLERRAAEREDGTIYMRSALTLTLVCDHRVLYGADAARFAGRVRELLQAPAALTL